MIQTNAIDFDKTTERDAKRFRLFVEPADGGSIFRSRLAGRRRVSLQFELEKPMLRMSQSPVTTRSMQIAPRDSGLRLGGSGEPRRSRGAFFVTGTRFDSRQTVPRRAVRRAGVNH
jgi:hypothetical protein